MASCIAGVGLMDYCFEYFFLNTFGYQNRRHSVAVDESYL